MTLKPSEPDVLHNPRLLVPVAMLFVAMLLIANTLAAKVVAIGPFSVPAGIVCFPISYIFGDVLVEVYGYGQTRRIIWCALFCQVLMAMFYAASTYLEPAVFWKGQEAWALFFGMSPRIVAGSLLGFFAGSFANALVMSRMKVWTAGRHMWARTIGSTIVGEGADSVVFNVVAFAGVFTAAQVGQIALSGYALKVAYEIIATPLTYFVANSLKRLEGVDHFDRTVSTYSPFHVAND